MGVVALPQVAKQVEMQTGESEILIGTVIAYKSFPDCLSYPCDAVLLVRLDESRMKPRHVLVHCEYARDNNLLDKGFPKSLIAIPQVAL